MTNTHYLGVDRGMFYIHEQAGLPWNGLVEVTESSPDSMLTQLHQDGQRIFVRRRDRDFELKVKTYAYPLEFEPYSGYSPGPKRPFGFSYRVMTGESSYQIHLVYNIVAIPDDLIFSTLADEIDPTYFAWTFKTRPVRIQGKVRSAHLIIDSNAVHSWTLEAIEDILYGKEGVIPKLPTSDEIEQLFQDNAIFKVVDNGDGTVTVTGPDEAIQALADRQVQLSWPSVIQHPSGFEYEVSSL